MSKIIYTDLNGDAPSVTAFGLLFADGVAVESDNPDLVKMAEANPWFEVIGGGPDEPDTPFNRGAAAARQDKKKSVPPAYRGKSEGDEWLEGYASVKPEA